MDIKEIKQLEDIDGRIYVLKVPIDMSEAELDYCHETLSKTFKHADYIITPECCEFQEINSKQTPKFFEQLEKILKKHKSVTNTK